MSFYPEKGLRFAADMCVRRTAARGQSVMWWLKDRALNTVVDRTCGLQHTR